MKEVITLLSCR